MRFADFFSIAVIVVVGSLRAGDVASPGGPPPERAIVIRTLPGLMKYDVREITAAPGELLKLTLHNADQLPHNLVVLREKGCALDVAMKAWELGGRGFEKHWIPDDPRVLAWTPTTDPGQESSVAFRAPDAEGDVDFVCSFPGHAMIMNGVLHVSRTPRAGPLTNLTFMHYKGEWSRLPDFEQLPAEARVRTDEINDGLIDLGMVEGRDNFAVVFNGTLDVPGDGTYRFFLGSDDGSRLLIEDERVVENDGIHSASRRVGRRQLKKGPHRIRVEYFERSGEEKLWLAWDGPGVRMQRLSKEGRGGAESAPSIVIGPRDGRAEIYRGFMQNSGGSRRIVNVGLPGQLNFAFDQDQLRVANIWKGQFLDVGRHWEGRGAGEVGASGYALIEFAPGGQFAVLDDAAAAWPALDETRRARHSQFKGYTLDASGIPTFRYETCGVEVEDRCELAGDIARGTEELVRSLTLRSAAPPERLFMRINSRQDFKAAGDRRFKAGTLTITIDSAESPEAHGADLLLPVRFVGSEAHLTVRHAWF